MATNSVRGRFFGSDNATVFLGELLGTALFVFLGCSSCLMWAKDGQEDTLQVGLSFGLAVMISVQIFGCVSGSHINPAVTIAAVIYDLISVQVAGLYIIAQLVGAVLGYGLLILLTPEEMMSDALCVTRPNALLKPYQAFGVEFIGTAALIWICCGVWDPRNAKSHDSVPIRFGLAVTGIALVTGHFTGGGLNPARSFGPAIWTGHFDSHYIYWIAPISGAIVASIIYKYIFRREVIESSSVCSLDKPNAESVA